jgi:acyl-CoA dehydrogenase
VVETARRIGEAVAAPADDAADRSARFPHEAMAALHEERLLGALVPRALGGLGATIHEVAACCEALGLSRASTAMIYGCIRSKSRTWCATGSPPRT